MSTFLKLVKVMPAAVAATPGGSTGFTQRAAFLPGEVPEMGQVVLCSARPARGSAHFNTWCPQTSTQGCPAHWHPPGRRDGESGVGPQDCPPAPGHTQLQEAWEI